ncbi:U32 family peptidase [Marinospirillum sp. MEB164]|uniref:Ubiquinone biosynthesis protein UbiV n=1 Tax=Marinospirillum alkalitolerans TaxID=3123374 RepID=A0ABW8PUW7_9GAMM
MQQLRLTLGPVLYYWPRAELLDFYQQVATWPVDVVYLGETVCARRREMKLDDWLAIAQDLAQAGKQVVLATQTLLESAADQRQLVRLIEAAQAHAAVSLVEASDMSAVEICTQLEQPFVAGPALNLYNPQSLALLARCGLKRWVFPLELSRTCLAEMQAWIQQHHPELETEVWGYGRAPLAWSARCFSARAQNLPKDRCQFVCQQHPQGLPLSSQEGAALFTLNGIQTLSAQPLSLLDQGASLAQLQVTHLRLSPENTDMSQLLERAVALKDPQQPPADPLKLVDLHSCNGYWYGLPGMTYQPPAPK